MSKHDDKQAQRDALREEQRKAQMRSNLIKRLKTFGIWAMSIIVILFIAALVIKATSISTTNMPTLILTQKASTDLTYGNTSSRNILIEYSDFQCPACAQAAPILDTVMREYEDDVLFIYRHFPLKQIHRHAVISARASEAAARQGKFWEMNKLLFENQDAWEKEGNPTKTFESYATQLGLNLEQFRKDFTSDEVAAKVENDYLSAVKYNLQGTPSFFLNGQRIRFGTEDELRAALNKVAPR